MKPIAILGTGGHAWVLKDALEAAGREAICYDHDEQHLIGPESELILGMGRRSARTRVAAEYISRAFITVVHPSAVVSRYATLEPGAQIMAGAIIQAGAKIGRHAIINTGAQVDHGCIIGDFAHICPGAILCADVEVGAGCMIEPGQVVLRGVKISRQVSGGEAYSMACP